MEIFEKLTGFFDEEKKRESEELRRIRGIKAKEFLESEFFQRHLLPYLEMERMGEYPSPGKKGWEEKYRLAYAKDEAYSKLLTTLKAWVSEGESIPVYDEDAPKKEIV